jgi:hypothetical protein
LYWDYRKVQATTDVYSLFLKISSSGKNATIAESSEIRAIISPIAALVIRTNQLKQSELNLVVFQHLTDGKRRKIGEKNLEKNRKRTKKDSCFQTKHNKTQQKKQSFGQCSTNKQTGDGGNACNSPYCSKSVAQTESNDVCARR